MLISLLWAYRGSNLRPGAAVFVAAFIGGFLFCVAIHRWGALRTLGLAFLVSFVLRCVRRERGRQTLPEAFDRQTHL